MSLHGDIERVLQLGALKLQLVNLLIARKFHVFLDAADFVIEHVIFLEHPAEISIRKL
jgi:hypothetical protein